MVVQEFRRRYLGSLLGNVWSFLNPLVKILVYTLVFSKIMRTRLGGSADTMAYSLFLCAGLLTWNVFSDLLGRSPMLFIDHASLLKKVSFPRITLPVTLFISTAIDFILTFGIFMLLLLIFGRFPGLALLAFIPLLLIQQALALGLGILVGTLNVFFRDIGHLMGIALQLWFWVTPIVYPANILPDRIQTLLEWNPMTQMVAAYQSIVLYASWPDWTKLQLPAVSAVLSLVFGFMVFQKLSSELVDQL
jgi:lipopolysaccharide transport system permease protein